MKRGERRGFYSTFCVFNPPSFCLLASFVLASLDCGCASKPEEGGGKLKESGQAKKAKSFFSPKKPNALWMREESGFWGWRKRQKRQLGSRRKRRMLN